MVAERRDAPAMPGERVERLENALQRALQQRNDEQALRAIAERQRDKYRDALWGCYPLAIAWGSHYQYIHGLDEMHATHGDAINSARDALERG